MIVKDLHERVGTARVIYVMSSVATATPVEAPAVVHLADSEHPPMGSSPRFGVRDLFARVLGDLVSLLKRYGGETAFTVYTRRLDV